MARRKLLELLRAYAYIEKEVILASGEKSDFYIDCRQVSLSPEGMALIGPLIYNEIRSNAPDAVAVGGPSIGADPLICAVVNHSYGLRPHLNGFFVRNEAKKHGLSRWLEGPHITPGAKVVLVEDVVTTGDSLAKVIEAVQSEGVEVAHLITLVNRSGLNELKGIPLTSLYTLEDLRNDSSKWTYSE